MNIGVFYGYYHHVQHTGAVAAVGSAARNKQSIVLALGRVHRKCEAIVVVGVATAEGVVHFAYGRMFHSEVHADNAVAVCSGLRINHIRLRNHSTFAQGEAEAFVVVVVADCHIVRGVVDGVHHEMQLGIIEANAAEGAVAVPDGVAQIIRCGSVVDTFEGVAFIGTDSLIDNGSGVGTEIEYFHCVDIDTVAIITFCYESNLIGGRLLGQQYGVHLPVYDIVLIVCQCGPVCVVTGTIHHPQLILVVAPFFLFVGKAQHGMADSGEIENGRDQSVAVVVATFEISHGPITFVGSTKVACCAC